MEASMSLKERIVGRLQQYPLLSQTMLTTALQPRKTQDLRDALEQLKAEGVVKEVRRATSTVTASAYYLRENEEYLRPFLNVTH